MLLLRSMTSSTKATLGAMISGIATHCDDYLKHNVSCSIRCPGAFRLAKPGEVVDGFDRNNLTSVGRLTCWDGTLFADIHCVDYVCPRTLFEGLSAMTSGGKWIVGTSTFWFATSYVPLGALAMMHYKHFAAATQRISELHAKLE
eukprot:SAG31_NODE_5968_length_2234_cov_1.716159_4_plen_145_part_00